MNRSGLVLGGLPNFETLECPLTIGIQRSDRGKDSIGVGFEDSGGTVKGGGKVRPLLLGTSPKESWRRVVASRKRKK